MTDYIRDHNRRELKKSFLNLGIKIVLILYMAAAFGMLVGLMV